MPDSLPEPSMRDLIDAIGGMTAIFTKILERSRLTDAADVSGHLRRFATIMSEDKPAAASIIAYWAAYIGETIDHDPPAKVTQ